MKRVLFVDDEQQILDGLQNLLRKQRREWDMVFALGAPAALLELEKSAFDVVVSDMRMPGMDGAGLLLRVKELSPATARIILSGHAERDAVVRVLPVAHQFLSKPCDAATLRSVIDRACGFQKLFEDKAILQVVGKFDKFPPVPDIYWELTSLLARPDTGIGDIAKVVERDPAMCVRLLQIVNSSFFGLAQRMSSIQQAVNYLGMELLKALVLTANLFGTEGVKDIPGFSMARFQQRSLATARLAKRLVGNSARTEEAFTAGMVHDIGQILIASSFPDRFAEIAAEVERSRTPVYQVERAILGITHAEVGGYLLGVWGLPLPIVEAVAFHHDPGRSVGEDRMLLAVVHAADALADCVSDVATPRDNELDMAFLERAGLANELPRWRSLAGKDPRHQAN